MEQLYHDRIECGGVMLPVNTEVVLVTSPESTSVQAIIKEQNDRMNRCKSV